MQYESVLTSVRRVFQDTPFTVNEAVVCLGYGKPSGPAVRHAAFVGGGGPPFPPNPVPSEKARQHAKSDIFRLYAMGLVNRRPAGKGRPGRRPYAYKVSPKGKTYLDWLRGHGLVDGFQAFVDAAAKDAVPPADRLLRRLRALEGGKLDRVLLSELESHLHLLLARPSSEAKISAMRSFAYAVIVATEEAPIEVRLRVDRAVIPFFVARYVIVPPNGATGPASKSSLDQALEMANLGIKAFETGVAAGRAGVKVVPSIPTPTPSHNAEKHAEEREGQAGTAGTGPVKPIPDEAHEYLQRYMWQGATRDPRGQRPSEKPDAPGGSDPQPSEGHDLPFHLGETFANRQMLVSAIELLARGETACLPWPRLGPDGRPVADTEGRAATGVLPLKRRAGDLEVFQRELQSWSGDAHALLRALVRAFGPTIPGDTARDRPAAETPASSSNLGGASAGPGPATAVTGSPPLEGSRPGPPSLRPVEGRRTRPSTSVLSRFSHHRKGTKRKQSLKRDRIHGREFPASRNRVGPHGRRTGASTTGPKGERLVAGSNRTVPTSRAQIRSGSVQHPRRRRRKHLQHPGRRRDRRGQPPKRRHPR